VSILRGRPGGWPLVAVVALSAVVLVNLPGLSIASPGAAQWVWALAATLAGVRLALRARAGLPWLLLATGVLMWSAGALYYDAVVVPGGVSAGGPDPSVADALWLGSYLPLAAGAVGLIGRGLAGRETEAALDGFVAALGAAALAVTFLPGAWTTAGGPAAVVALLLPVGDVLLIGIVAAGFALAGGRVPAPWLWLGAGLLTLAVTDLVFAFEVALGQYAMGGLDDVGWPLALWLLAASAHVDRRSRPAPVRLRTVPVVPLAGAALAIGVLAADQAIDAPVVAEMLAIAALMLAVARTALALHVNARLHASAEQALTDELTGLANRRRLMRDLDRLVAGRSDATLVLFDLDGFKAYNDAYGHLAGDALLAALGRRLARAVGACGRAYRLGGDEFCVLVTAADVDHELVLDRAIDALRQDGDGFSIGASYGRVAVPEDATSASEALQLADTRMYQRKDAGRASTRRQSRDLLLQLLHEQQPDLEEHSGDVGDLVAAVGRRLGLDSEALDHARHAAELHDVGKVAIPAAILRKPGPLDDDEWALMKRHTIIGERILSAVPALVPVGRIVRSTHERWDGGGYPDGLRGEEIPLAARIIAVCDTFHAITTDRPYREGRSPEEALEELRRCAGSQFDPAVVEAFAAELAAGAATGEGAGRESQGATEGVARRVAPAGAIAQSAAGELAELAKLRGLLHAARLARGGADVADVLDAIARTIATSLGFRVVSVNLFRPAGDEFVCTAVHGGEDVRARLLGKVEPASSWRPLLDERFARAGAYFVPAGALDYGDDDEVIWHVPDIAPTDDPGAWQADDVLVVPLMSTGGDLLGMVSVDEPVWGRRPSDDAIEVLVAVAEHASIAVQSARDARRDRAAREAEARIAALGPALAGSRGADVAELVAGCVREALAFGHAAVDVADGPRTAAALEDLLVAGEELHGCVVLGPEPARRARAWRGLAPGSARNGRGTRAWRDHLVAAPVRGAGGELLAVVWADDPADRLLPDATTLRALRAIAAQAVVPLAWGRGAPAPAADAAAA
jgi:diguanylate cyclase (GGDEF)-like protein